MSRAGAFSMHVYMRRHHHHVEPKPGGDSDDEVDDSQPVIAGDGVSEDQKVKPPSDSFQAFPGYDNIAMETAFCPPPKPVQPAVKPQGQQPEFTSVPVISEDAARQALFLKIAEECCWGKRAAEQLAFTNLESSTSYHYILETFTEGRGTDYDHEPYRPGMPVDGPQNGRAPLPWEIPSEPNQLFKNQVRHIEVPHTAYVKGCHRCHATGKLICSSCRGRGQKRCGRCHGSGRRRVRRNKEWRSVRCSSCGGDGRRRCGRCHGTGRVTCGTCDGYCQLKWFIKLTITWENKIGEHIIERTALPDELIKEVAGNVIFNDEQFRVPPITAFHDNELNVASQKLVQAHNFQTLRILKQRHQVRAVPVTQCYYKWKEQNLDYFVFGLDNQVYSPSYPHQCCWGCTIL